IGDRHDRVFEAFFGKLSLRLKLSNQRLGKGAAVAGIPLRDQKDFASFGLIRRINPASHQFLDKLIGKDIVCRDTTKQLDRTNKLTVCAGGVLEVPEKLRSRGCAAAVKLDSLQLLRQLPA